MTHSTKPISEVDKTVSSNKINQSNRILTSASQHFALNLVKNVQTQLSLMYHDLAPLGVRVLLNQGNGRLLKWFTWKNAKYADCMPSNYHATHNFSR